MYTFYNTPRLLIELDKAVVLWSDWLVVCDCGFSLSALWCPLSAPTALLGFLLPSMWGISSWLLQQSTAAAPYLGRGVAPLRRSTPAPSQPTLLNWCSWTVWCWRRLLRAPWTARRSNLSILKEISPGCSLEGLLLKLKLQYFGYLMRRADSFEKTMMVGKIEGRRRRGWQRMRLLADITDSMDTGLGGLRELVMDREAWRAAVHRVSKSRKRLNDWTEHLINSSFL